MDPLSLTTGIIALLGASSQAAKAIRQLAALKNVPDLVLALNNEIADLHLVLLAIQDVFERQQSSGVPFPGGRRRTGDEASVDATLVSFLGQAKAKVGELEALHRRLVVVVVPSEGSGAAAGAGALNKAVWLRVQKRVKRIQEELRTVRLNLAAALVVVSS